MARALTEQGTEVIVATSDADGPDKLPVELGKLFAYQGTQTIVFPVRWSERFTYAPALAGWLKKKVSAFEVVHIHAIFSHPSLTTASACQKLSVPYIVRPLGSLDPWSLAQNRLPKKALIALSVRRMLRKAAAVHYTSAEERRSAEVAFDLSNGVVIPLGVELPQTNHDRSSSLVEPYVLFLSRLHPKKNLESLIEAFGQLVTDRQFAHWKLVIAGDGDATYVGKLKQLSNRNPARYQIKFIG